MRRATGRIPAPSARSCHAERGADRMQVRLAVAQNCLDCHGIRAAHLSAPDSACATCHVPLAQAVRLTRSGCEPSFPLRSRTRRRASREKGHGKLAG